MGKVIEEQGTHTVCPNGVTLEGDNSLCNIFTHTHTYIGVCLCVCVYILLVY